MFLITVTPIYFNSEEQRKHGQVMFAREIGDLRSEVCYQEIIWNVSFGGIGAFVLDKYGLLLSVCISRSPNFRECRLLVSSHNKKRVGQAYPFRVLTAVSTWR